MILTMTKYDVKRVPRELLEELADKVIEAEHCKTACSITFLTRSDGILTKIAQAATVPLRTRAKVDADIVKLVRECANWTSNYGGPGGSINYISAEFDKTTLDKGGNWPGQQFRQVLAGLLDEETLG